MRQQFNKEISAYLAGQYLGGDAFWQVRGIVLEVEEVEHPSRDEKARQLRDLLVKVGDLDDGSDGFDVRIEGVYYQIESHDIVSLVGHEREGATAVSHPRLIINHSTGGLIARVYPLGKRLIYGEMPLIEYKYWLARWLYFPRAARSLVLGVNFWKVFAWLAALWVFSKIGGEKFALFGLLGGFISMGFLLLVALSVLPTIAALKAVERLIAQPPFSFEKRKVPSLLMKNMGDYTSNIFFDITLAYEGLARRLHKDALKNPAPQIGFVPVERGLYTSGLLQPSVQFLVPDTAPRPETQKPAQPTAPNRPVATAPPEQSKPRPPMPRQATLEPTDPKTETYRNKTTLRG